jgi:hypothetical protein
MLLTGVLASVCAIPRDTARLRSRLEANGAPL